MPSVRTRSVNIPVRVIPKSSPTAATPAVAPVTRPAPIRAPKKRPAPVRPSFPRPTIDAVSEPTRRKMMWVSVALFAILLGGGTFYISSQRDSNGSLASFWSRVTSTFSGLKWPQREVSAAEKEIRALDAQVFPDFAQ